MNKDNIVEEPETFDIILTIPLSLSGKVELGTISKAIGNITDDTSKIICKQLPLYISSSIFYIVTTLRFNESAYSVDESSGVFQVVLVLSNSLLSDLIVEVDIINATDFGKCSYYSTSMNNCHMYGRTGKGRDVLFPAGIAIAILIFSINDDTILEEDDIFILSINKSSLPSQVIVGDPDEAIVTIADDDGNYINNTKLKNFVT